MRLPHNDSCSPSPEQELLLKAALLDGEEAFMAWRNWMSSVDFDRLDCGSQRLLPLLYMNLVKHKAEHPAMNVYKGFYRMNWYKNQILSRRIAEVLRLLDANGIHATLLKGAALAPAYYVDWAVRPMNDFDVLVPPCDTLKAFDLLSESGWQPLQPKPEEADLRLNHACILRNADGLECDLHWRIMHETGLADEDLRITNDSREIDFLGGTVSILSPAGQLLHVLVHGTQWNVVPPIRWVADAVMIIRKEGGEIDWTALIEEARKRYLIPPVRNALFYLAETFGASVPAEALIMLKNIRPSIAERIEGRMRSRPRGIIRDVFYLWFAHVRKSGVTNIALLLQRFPSFLRDFWSVPPDRNLSLFLLSRLVRRLRGKGRELATS
jgi:hypothetical protein